MELTKEHLERIKDCLPVERGNVSIDVLRFLNGVLYVAENGCKWRRLPERFGNWHTSTRACLPFASALTVVPSAVTLTSESIPDSDPGQYALTIYQDAAQSDGTTSWFDYHADTQELVFRTGLLNEGADWYFIATGETFSLSGIALGAYEELNGFNQPFPLPYGEFYLGGATGQGFSPEWEANRTVLAWAHFSASASGVTLLGSAAAYDAGSIIVGTLSATPIPETASAPLLIALASLGFVAAHRRPRI